MMKICSYCIHPYVLNDILNTLNTIVNDISETNICYDCFNIIDEEVNEYTCRFCKLIFNEKILLQMHIRKSHPINSIKLNGVLYNTLKYTQKPVPAETKKLHNILKLHLTSPRESVRQETKKQILDSVNTNNHTYKVSEKILNLQRKLLESSTCKIRSKSTPKY